MKQYKPGDQIGGEYEVLKVFGGENQSGMGVVYLVKNREAPIPFVMKTFQGSLSLIAKKQFLSECNSWINAGAHQNIVQAIWVREIADQIFIAAEYVAPDEQGRSNLSHFLKAGLLRIEVVLLWATQFCDGMSYAKSKGVLVHRDIKPDNLMIDQTATLKVIDFGLAKSIESNIEKIKRNRWWSFRKHKITETHSWMKTGSAMGTPFYMAPEQFVNAKAVDHRADIYSFGIVLFQMVTGNKYPYRINFDRKDNQAEFFKAHSVQPPLLVDSPLMPIIQRCLAKKASNRYSTYEELRKDLEAVARQLNIKVPSISHVAKEDVELFTQAQSYFALGESGRALDAINEYTSKYNENFCGWTEKGKIHLQRGENSEGLSATKKSIEINPYNSHAWNNLGIALDRTQHPFSEIKIAYTNALFYDPCNTAAMMNLIGPLVIQKDYLLAAELVAKAMKLSPEKPIIRQKAEALVREFTEAKNFIALKILLSGWTEARPNDVDPLHNLGLIVLELGDIAFATKCFKRVHELCPKDNFAVVQLANLCFKQQKGRECLDYCDELLKRQYDDPNVVAMKARVMNWMGAYELALNFLQAYIDKYQTIDLFLVVRAELYEYQEKYDLAISSLQHAKRLLESTEGKHTSDNLQFIDEKIQRLSLLK